MSDTQLTPGQVAAAEANVARESVPHQALVSLDQFGNVVLSPILFLQRGQPDETISAHVRRIVDDPAAKHQLVAKIINRLLDALQHNHGAGAEAGDLERAQKVEEIEKRALGLDTPAVPHS